MSPPRTGRARRRLLLSLDSFDQFLRVDGFRYDLKFVSPLLSPVQDLGNPRLSGNSRIFTDGYIFRTAIASSTPFIPGINMSDKI